MRFVADAVLPVVMMEGFAVVYHPASGATHLLASPVPEILATIAPGRGAASAAEVVERLAASFDLDGDGLAVVTARLAELDAAGLVRRT